MTNHQTKTNGASLEDCHTNFYALTDLCGIKWRKLVSNDRPNASSDPLDDPVLRSYSRCLAADILCVWRRVAGIRNDAISIYDVPSNVVHPPLSLTAAKELWIFWYGEEPDLTDLVVPELLRANEGTTDHGSWETGLSYEGRGLLFKALHNLIERSLLSRDVVLRLGRWFVQPCNGGASSAMAMSSAGQQQPAMGGAAGASLYQNAAVASTAATAAASASHGSEQAFGKSSHNLSFSFAFFVHGDSTVCASIDLREHPPVRRLTMDHLNEAVQHAAAAAANHQQSPPPPPSASKAQTPLASPAGATGGSGGGMAGETPPKPRRVILAPFGMSGTLTGQMYRLGSLDPATQKALDDWCAFYPLSVLPADSTEDLPVMVEVVTGGVKLRYPTKYVLVSDIDELDGEADEPMAEQQSGDDLLRGGTGRLAASISGNLGGTKPGDPQPNRWKASITNSIAIKSVDLKQTLSSAQPSQGNDLGHPLRMHLRPTVATVLAERVWQDCILNPLDVAIVPGSKDAVSGSGGSGSSVGASSSLTTALPMVSPSQIKQEPMETTSAMTPGQGGSGGRTPVATGPAEGASCTANTIFKFIDPSQKSTCSCTKCKRGTGRGSSSSAGGSTSASSVVGGGGGGSVGATISGSRSEKSSRPARIPFHKRPAGSSQPNQRPGKSKHESNSSSSGPVPKPQSSSTASLFNVLGNAAAASGGAPNNSNALQRAAKSSNANAGQAAGSSAAAASGESNAPMTSCGNSPGSAEPSPHGNATGLSQQSLPSELLPILSPSVDQHPSQASLFATGAVPTPPTTTVMEKLLNSENSSTNNNLNSVDATSAKSSLSQAAEDRLGGSATGAAGRGVSKEQPPNSGSASSSAHNNLNSSIANTSKVNSLGVNNSNNAGCSSSKRKMDYSNSVNLNSANSSGINSVNPSGSAAGTVPLKRPTLMSRDYENIIDDDLEPHQLLYDYSSEEAWFNVLVKRCRVSEEVSQKVPKSVGYRDNELYAMHQRQLQLRKEQQQLQQKNLSSLSSTSLSSSTGILLGSGAASSSSSSQLATNSPGGSVGAATEGSAAGGGTAAEGFNLMSPAEMSLDYQVESPLHDIKTGISTAEDEGGGGGGGGGGALGETKSLLTSKGLQPSIKDLENLFDDNLMGGCDDNSNDESIQVETPPASNKSVSGTGSEETVATTTIKKVISSGNASSGGLSTNLGGLGASSVEMITKMMTPPSLEPKPDSSPCGGALSDGGGPLSTDIEMKVAAVQEVDPPAYPNLGSPMEEQIDDWSYVFLPTKMCKLVGSTKYAPLTDLPSQALPSVQLSVNCVYEASWEKKPKALPPMKPIKSGPMSGNKEIAPNPLMMAKAGLMSIKQEPQLPGSPLGGGGMQGNSSSLASVTNPMLTAQLSRPPPLQVPHGPSSLTNPMAPMVGHPMHPGMPPHLRGMSPMFSPNPMQQQQHPMTQQMPFRRTPIAPPPPYELAVASPANQGPNFSGMVPGNSNDMMHMQRMMMLNQQQSGQMMGGFPGGPPHGAMMGNNFGGMINNNSSSSMLMAHQAMTPSNAMSASTPPGGVVLPEADSLLVNILLYDTLLNIFRDHNFDSCTICVCNASVKCVGNIRGSDSGVYLALPGTSFAQMTSELGSKKGGGGGGNAIGGFNGAFDGSGGGMDNSVQNGYLDEDPIRCQCGFSAVVNRRLAHRSGLFYEDEMEITGMAVDPAVYKKRSLLSYIMNELQGVNGTAKDTNNNVSDQRVVVKQEPGTFVPLSRSNTPMVGASPAPGADGGNTNSSSSGNNNNCDNGEQDALPLAIMELLRDQCATLVQGSSSSIMRAIRRFQSEGAQVIRTAVVNLNVLEYTEAHDVITLALEQARIAFEGSAANGGATVKLEMDSFGNPIPNPHQMMRVNNGPLSSTSSVGSSSALMRSVVGGGGVGQQGKLNLVRKGSFNVHRWPYVAARGPRSNQDIIRLMKSMQPILQDAFHKECKTRLWDAPYTVKGPLTWRQFHRLASSSTTDQCEPQPIPSIIVGHERDWLNLSPYALQYWDKLLLEPYSYSRDIAYIVVAPDNDFVVGKVKTFFKELSTTYEMCKLGRHTPIKAWDGIFRVGKAMKHIAGVTNDNSAAPPSNDEWFNLLGESKLGESLKLYQQACQSYLVPYLSKVPGDKSLLEPPESYIYPVPPGPYGSNASSAVNLLNKSLPSPMLPPNTPEPSTTEKAPTTPKSSEADGADSKDALNTSAGGPNAPQVEPLSNMETDDTNPPCIVIYIVEPFTCGNDSPELQRLACLSLLRCYSGILNAVPDSIRGNISFQIVSQESICELGRSRSAIRWSDEMRCMALSVFSQCRRFMTHVSHGKSLTGFGTAAQMELFLKGKDEKYKIPYKLYTPPYILSAKQAKSEKVETFGKKGREQQSSVLYVSYCLSKDQNWLLAVATDERGELLETVTINVDVPNRARRKKASARLFALQKLMDFILGVISQTMQPWRLVIGRVGRIGHGELKGWSYLLSKANLLKASKHLKEICKQCSLLSPGVVPSILSGCLIAMEPDSNLRVMPDQFTPDERFSQMSVQNPLSTPQDVSSTHILVFPLSAKTQSQQTNFNNMMDVNIMDEEFLPNLEDDDDCLDDNVGFNDLFNGWDDQLIQPTSPDRRSRPGSPGMDEIMVPRNTPGPSNSNGGQKSQQDNEEIGQLLQQPLSLGYMVSTAPMCQMPDWFWASCPHMENVCPVFLKTALHIHSPSIHSTQDELLQQSNNSPMDHPLDSSFTEVVLRHVMEGYNVLSWLAMDSNTHDRLSCLPIHVQLLMQLYHMSAALT